MVNEIFRSFVASILHDIGKLCGIVFSLICLLMVLLKDHLIYNKILFILFPISLFLAILLLIHGRWTKFKMSHWKLILLLLPSIFAYTHILFSMEQIYENWSWDPGMKLFMLLFYPFLILFMFTIGSTVYLIFSYPRILEFFLCILFYLIKFSNYVKFIKTSRKFRFDKYYREINRLSDCQIFAHMLFELFLISFLIQITRIDILDFPHDLEIKMILTDISFKLILCLSIFFSLIFPLHIAGFRWGGKPVGISIIHGLLPFSTAIVFLFRIGILPGEEICTFLLLLIHNMEFWVLYLSGISLGFLAVCHFSLYRIEKYFHCKKKLKFLEIEC